jgi:BlaI family transcriptional regulator, penicillinase repressor
MPKPQQDVTDAELAVLQRLWEAGAATIRELTAVLYPGGGTSRYATVQKLLERLEGKGHVRRDAGEVPHRFAAAVGRGELIGRRLRTMADKLCGGALAPLLTNLVESRSLTPREIGELRVLIDRLDRDASRTSSTRRRK